LYALQVHVFETTIRVLGGLLSGHVLLHEDPGLVPGYDGLLLREAQDLGDRLMAAFDTPSGLPGGHVHLQKVGLELGSLLRGRVTPSGWGCMYWHAVSCGRGPHVLTASMHSKMVSRPAALVPLIPRCLH
jgi:hypothetical protein